MMTRAEAIARLVDLDVARWGEGERAASQSLRSRLSHGLALNSLAHYECWRAGGPIDTALAAEAMAAMTAADRRVLREGG